MGVRGILFCISLFENQACNSFKDIIKLILDCSMGSLSIYTCEFKSHVIFVLHNCRMFADLDHIRMVRDFWSLDYCNVIQNLFSPQTSSKISIRNKIMKHQPWKGLKKIAQ